MLLDQMHPEIVKAVIRKRFGTIGRFQESRDLPSTAVADLMRGKGAQRTREAVEEVLQEEETNPINLGDSEPATVAHRLSGTAR